MRVIPIVISLVFFSCQLTKDSKDTPVVTSELPSVQLPSFVEQKLNSDLKGWQIAATSDWQDTTFRKFQTDSSQINYFINDFNCDGKQDFAGILKDSVGNYATFKIYSIEEYYTYSQLENYGKQPSLTIGLRFLDSKTPFQSYDGSLETFKCGAIERFNTQNKGKKLFYGNEKGFFEIEVGQ